VIILFQPRHYPTILQEKLEELDRKVFWQSYMHGIYTLDPFYKLCTQGERGMFHLQDIAPWDFFTSVYFKQYFSPADIRDEINYIFQAVGGISGLVCISRSHACRRFNEQEKKTLQDMAEFIDAAITRHLEISSVRLEKTSSFRPLSPESLDKFTCGRLTHREHEITHLMLQGFSSKVSANFLAISPETERTHRKNIYKKMRVNSQAELLAHTFRFLLEAPRESPARARTVA